MSNKGCRPISGLFGWPDKSLAKYVNYNWLVRQVVGDHSYNRKIKYIGLPINQFASTVQSLRRSADKIVQIGKILWPVKTALETPV